jgi:hypothetical protein
MISPESCSLRNWALKDSMKPFCQGDPGSMNAGVDAGGVAPVDQGLGGEFRPLSHLGVSSTASLPASAREDIGVQ